jgi:hypothetical protein
MAGLYPAKHRTQKDDTVHHTIYPDALENLVMHFDCPAIQTLKKEMRAEPPLRKRIEQSMPTFQKLHAIFDDKNHTDVDHFIAMFDTLQARNCNDMPLPSYNGLDVSATDLETVVSYEDFECEYMWRAGSSKPRRFSQIASSHLLKEVFMRLEGDENDNIQQDAPSISPKFYLYSAHDTTLLNMLGVLNSNDVRWPPYASNLLLELWRVRGKAFVRVIYNGKVMTPVDSWCNLDKCDFDMFKEYLRPSLELDIVKECSLH